MIVANIVDIHAQFLNFLRYLNCVIENKQFRVIRILKNRLKTFYLFKHETQRRERNL